jgi:UDP-N-acetylglucosamine:LPS N-acetylglucosamine transferase
LLTWYCKNRNLLVEVIESHVNSIKRKRILLSPLNWGLGHVTRTIPIIQAFIQSQNEVIICCDSDQEEIYRKYFPELWYVYHKGYPFSFKGKGNWSLDIMRHVFSLNDFLAEEKKRVDQLVEKFNPDLVISDQRFGFLSVKVKSIIISHQLNLPLNRLNIAGKLLNKRMLNRFDEIWIPDNGAERLSGDLSNGANSKSYFIGTCSRFHYDAIDKYLPRQKTYKYLGIVSGPSPYSDLFLADLIQKFSKLEDKCSIISHVKGDLNSIGDNVDFFLRPDHELFLKTLLKSDTVISRSGYTTLMDIIETGNKAIFIPTKGQKEQVYLAKHLRNRDRWYFCSEEEFAKIDL